MAFQNYVRRTYNTETGERALSFGTRYSDGADRHVTLSNQRGTSFHSTNPDSFSDRPIFGYNSGSGRTSPSDRFHGWYGDGYGRLNRPGRPGGEWDPDRNYYRRDNGYSDGYHRPGRPGGEWDPERNHYEHSGRHHKQDKTNLLASLLPMLMNLLAGKNQGTSEYSTNATTASWFNNMF